MNKIKPEELKIITSLKQKNKSLLENIGSQHQTAKALLKKLYYYENLVGNMVEYINNCNIEDICDYMETNNKEECGYIDEGDCKVCIKNYFKEKLGDL